MYLHCHSCDWEQDDFYDTDGYNPAEYLKSWNEMLLNENLDDIFNGEGEKKTKREVLAREYENFAIRIRGMRWVTYEQWQKEKDTAVCPQCGKRDFDID